MPTAKKSRKTPRASDKDTGVQKVSRDNEQSQPSSLTISYLTLRKTVGLLGTALPFIVFLGGLVIFQTELQGSISSYYYTGMRDVFVGVLCAIGIFLYSYKGYERKDDLAGNFACVFAIGVAFFPTTPEGTTVSNVAVIVGYLHLGFAAAFFTTLSYFSLVLFTKTHQNSTKGMTLRKQQRNGIYKVCGYLMLACIVLMGIYSFMPSQKVAFLSSAHPIYWLEALAIVAFGISWLVKGEALLADEN